MVRKQWAKQRAKKAGVALGGGTVIGTGLVIHPFGSFLMASRFSAHNTEFELPGKKAHDAQDSSKKWVEEDKPTPKHHEVPS